MLITHPSEEEAIFYRDRALLALSSSTGLLLKQIIQANVGDLDWHTGLLRLPCPRRRERVTAVSDTVLDLLEAYQDAWPEEPQAEEPLFQSRQGRAGPPALRGHRLPWRWHPRRLSMRQVRRILGLRAEG
jgi:site-specific recombinase XerC